MHKAIEAICRQVGKTAANQNQSRVVEALRSLGGITELLRVLIAQFNKDWSANPRMIARAIPLTVRLTSQLPTLREQTQRLLVQLNRSLESSAGVVRRQVRENPITSRDGLPTAVRSVHRLVSMGTTAEVPLSDSAGEWIGIADLIRLTEDQCEIVDFKTGERRPEHEAQLRLYALLWFLDRIANPEGRLATALTLMYLVGPQSVIAPEASELEAMAMEMHETAEAVKALVSLPPPSPRPSPEACGSCDVRQCCPIYWSPEVLALVAGETTDSGWIDAELKLLERHATTSWRAKIVASAALPKGTEVLVRFDSKHPLFLDLLLAASSGGAVIRAVGAQWFPASGEPGGVPALLLGGSTELFLS